MDENQVIVWTLAESNIFPLLVAADEKGDAVICADGAHVAHADGKGYAGMFITMGKGSMMSVSNKVGLVATSST